MQETHKFESRYLDSLIGPYPEDKAVYEERSPINALDRFQTPVAFFQVLCKLLGQSFFYSCSVQ